MTIRTRRTIILGLAGGAAASVLSACQATPTPEVKQAAAPAAPGLSKLFLMVDIVQGSKNLAQADRASRSCVLSSRFPRNSEMVWRIRVHDPASGETMDDKLLKGVAVQIANGKALEGKYGPHPKDPPNEHYWTADWVVPKDHPTGTLKFTVEATALDGRTGTFEPMPVLPSLPTITEDILADAPAKA